MLEGPRRAKSVARARILLRYAGAVQHASRKRLVSRGVSGCLDANGKADS